MAKSLLSSLKQTFNPAREDPSVPTPDLSRVLKAPKARPAPVQVEPPKEAEASQVPESDASEFQGENWLAQDISSLQDALNAFREEPNEPRCRRALFLCAHNLRGAAEPLGKPNVSRMATSLCRLIEASGSAPSDLHLADLHVQAIRAAADGTNDNETTSAVCVALEDSVRNRGKIRVG